MFFNKINLQSLKLLDLCLKLNFVVFNSAIFYIKNHNILILENKYKYRSLLFN